MNPAETADVSPTVITVSGSGFGNPQDLRCNFGSKSVVADYVSSTEIKCVAPAIRLAQDETGREMKFWISGGGEISNSQDFLYFGTLLVSDSGNAAVHLFDSHHGHYIKTLIPSGSGGLKDPQGVAYGQDGNIYVASSGSNQILKYNPQGKSMGVFAELPKHCIPRDIQFGPDSNLFVACSSLARVIALNANSGQQLGVAAQGGGLSQPVGIAFGPGNTLYVVSTGSKKVLKYAQGGYFQGAVHTSEDRGSDVALFEGKIFLTGGQSTGNSILMLDGSSAMHHAESFQLHNPVAIAFDPAGYLYASSGNAVLRFTARGRFISTMKVRGDFGQGFQATFMATSPREVKRKTGRHDEL